MITWILGFAGGVTLWTLLEYVLHRFVFHRRVLGKTLAREHIEHHAAVDYFAPMWLKGLAAVVVLTVVSSLAVLAVGVELGTSLPLGLAIGWMVYEAIHRLIHVSAPLGSYGTWARRHHLLHHFGRADANHGVTTPFWDIAFGTLAERQTIKVPRRHATKFPWLLAPESEKPEIADRFEGDYRLV